jgi:hypothetical protein
MDCLGVGLVLPFMPALASRELEPRYGVSIYLPNCREPGDAASTAGRNYVNALLGD